MRSHISFGTLLIWLQVTLAVSYQIQQLPELDFLSDNLTPSECLRFHKLFKRHQFVVPETKDQNEMNLQPREFGVGSLDCKKLLLTSWFTMEPKLPIAKTHELLDLKLRQIGRTDLAQWLGYNNVIRQKEFYSEGTKSSQNASNENATKKDDHHSKVSTVENTKTRTDDSKQTLLQKLVITMLAILSMTTLYLFCYKILYGRMKVGHFTAFRRKEEFDEESWLQQDQQQRERGAGSNCNCTASYSDTKRLSFWNSVDRNLGLKNLSIVDYFGNRLKRHADSSRDKRNRQLRNLVSRLQNTCPTERKIIDLTKKEQSLLKSLSNAEKIQLPATDSDIKFLVATDREKEKLLTREARREFLFDLRKRLLERIRNFGCISKNQVTLNETERDIIKKLSKSERMFLPITNKDLELLVTSPFEKRRLILKQIANKFRDIISEDRKYFELENDEKKLLKYIDDKEKKKLGLNDSELRFLVASKSQRKIMQRKLNYRDRDYRLKEIRKRLSEVKNDVSRLELSKIERSTFLSLNSNELKKLGLTEDHLRYYEATDLEKRIIWPSPSQQRNLQIESLKTKLSKLPWKECGTRLTSSEHTMLASLTPGEQMKIRISDSEKNFMLSTDSEKELIKRQRRIEKLESKIRDFNNVTMSESERGLMVSLSPSEMEMLNLESRKKCSIIDEGESESFGIRETRIKLLGEKLELNLETGLTNSEEILLGSLNHEEISMIRLTNSRVDLILSNASRKRKIETIKGRIGIEGLSKIRLTNSERWLIQSLNKFEMNFANLSKSQVSFLLRKEKQDFLCNSSQRDFRRKNDDDKSNNEHSYQGNEMNFQEDIYDELGMRFSKNIKRQARPCQRNYCLLGRHLRRGTNHDERQCQARQDSCRGFSNEQRPSCSNGKVCIDTYEEFNSMKCKNESKCGHCVNDVGNS